ASAKPGSRGRGKAPDRKRRLRRGRDTAAPALLLVNIVPRSLSGDRSSSGSSTERRVCDRGLYVVSAFGRTIERPPEVGPTSRNALTLGRFDLRALEIVTVVPA